MLPYTHQFHTFHHHLIPSVAWLFWRGNGNCRWCAWFPRRPWHRRIRSLNSWELRSPVPGHDAWTILDPWWLLACPCHVGLLLSFEAWMSTHLCGGLCAWWATGTGRWSADSGLKWIPGSSLIWKYTALIITWLFWKEGGLEKEQVWLSGVNEGEDVPIFLLFSMHCTTTHSVLLYG